MDHDHHLDVRLTYLQKKGSEFEAKSYEAKRGAKLRYTMRMFSPPKGLNEYTWIDKSYVISY